ncbi:DUF1793-domain-containing protein [Gymnopus androsaceus JB14]|uniref:DUF1793-domain-containing protein n=1 Tax=Gymnopus androsaceus JB14 TaxID=1447944 RepID=A0A6A4I2Y1_9AGAR|nr:DUF1793-domain-containing protein [Gymnopus androsaceus JB14]
MAHNTGASVPNNWPNFWTTSHILGWSGLLRVDDVPYEWLGGAVEGPGLVLTSNATAATLKDIAITPTRTILTLTVGAMNINVTFLSPIEPSNLTSSNDGKSHSLQVYQDISGEWTSSNTSNVIQWNTTTSDSIIYHEVQRSPFQYMTEKNNMAEDAVSYHVTTSGSGVTWQTGQDVLLRSLFLNNGTLNNTQDKAFRVISDDWPVFAYCTDLGSISSTSTPVVWGIGLVRDGDIIYSTTSGNQTRRPYFFTKYPDVPSALSDLMSNASDALQRAITLDNKILSAANTISSNYADLVSLASRQVMAGMEITVGTDSSGQINASDIMFFMKDIGNSQRSGATFPSAAGDNDPSVFTAIESTSDMLSVVWAHATFTGDSSLISQYYTTFKNWTDTLVSENPLAPNGLYTTADGLSNPNMTNLAIKGILAIRTMAEISRTLGMSDDYDSYSGTASSMVSQWQSLAGASGHLSSTYSAPDSWGLIYNLYPDKLFGFNFVEESIYTEQTQWYTNAASTSSGQPFGLPFDSNNDAAIAKSQWTLFTAGTVTDPNTRDILVSMVHAGATNMNEFTVFPTAYSSSNGSYIGGAASPAQGAMFALLALNLTKQPISGFTPASNSSNFSHSPKSHVGAIAGGVVGGAVIAVLVVLAIIFYCRRRSRTLSDHEKMTSVVPYPPVLNPSQNTSLTPLQVQDDTTLHGSTQTSSQKSILPVLYGNTSRTTAGSSSSRSAPSDSGSSNAAAELRGEVQNLRREMEAMRLRAGYEPPPEYAH